jgi:MGT family glycosyltransferase
MSDGNPVILVSESTASANGSKYFNDCIEAFTGSKYQVVMSVSERSSRIGLRQIPSNFQINTTARNVEILPHASLTICQGGMGTTLESIYHGVPVLAVPITPYHAEVAFRTEELGLGRFISEAVITPARIRATVDEMLGDTALHDRLRLAQRSYASSNASKAAANRIEEFLRRKLVESGT